MVISQSTLSPAAHSLTSQAIAPQFPPIPSESLVVSTTQSWDSLLTDSVRNHMCRLLPLTQY